MDDWTEKKLPIQDEKSGGRMELNHLNVEEELLKMPPAQTLFRMHFQAAVDLRQDASKSQKNPFKEPQTASVFRGALESRAVTSQKPQRMYISRGTKSPGFILL